jgi:hypothetical protein
LTGRFVALKRQGYNIGIISEESDAMNPKYLFWCCLVISVLASYPPRVSAQTVDDSGSKWTLELQMRSEASLIHDELGRYPCEVPGLFPNLGDFVSKSLVKMIDEERVLREMERRKEMEHRKEMKLQAKREEMMRRLEKEKKIIERISRLLEVDALTETGARLSKEGINLHRELINLLREVRLEERRLRFEEYYLEEHGQENMNHMEFPCEEMNRRREKMIRNKIR